MSEKKIQTQQERILVPVTLLLLATGLVMVYSASAVIATRQYADSLFFLKKQIVWVLLGAGAIWFFAKIEFRRLENFVIPMVGLALIGLILVLIPGVGAEINGSRRWIRLGPITAQPSEFARLALVVYLACYLANRQERMGSFIHGLLPPILIVGLMLSLILAEPDLGTAAVMGLVAGFMFFIGGARWRHVLGILAVCGPVLYALIMKFQYRRQRLSAFLDPWKDPTDSGFQIIQSFIAFGGGGPIGVGLGEGRQKLFFLPYPHTDFIYAVIGEELGLIGCVGILAMFAVLAWRGFVIANRAPDGFGRFLALGLTLMIVVQAEVNMAVVTGLLPTKGLTLPFMSYGGSSLLMSCVAIGMLLSITRARDYGSGERPRGTSRTRNRRGSKPVSARRQAKQPAWSW